MGKQYGKDKMLDGCPDTCWQSKEGKPQSITLEFDRPRLLMNIVCVGGGRGWGRGVLGDIYVCISLPCVLSRMLLARSHSLAFPPPSLRA